MPLHKLRLIVPTASGAAVLARPNGLAGWALPAIAVATPFDAWNDDAASKARALLQAELRPVRPIADGAWLMELEGRIPAVGSTWIPLDQVARFGADAGVISQWIATSTSDG